MTPIPLQLLITIISLVIPFLGFSQVEVSWPEYNAYFCLGPSRLETRENPDSIKMLTLSTTNWKTPDWREAIARFSNVEAINLTKPPKDFDFGLFPQLRFVKFESSLSQAQLEKLSHTSVEVILSYSSERVDSIPAGFRTSKNLKWIDLGFAPNLKEKPSEKIHWYSDLDDIPPEKWLGFPGADDLLMKFYDDLSQFSSLVIKGTMRNRRVTEDNLYEFKNLVLLRLAGTSDFPEDFDFSRFPHFQHFISDVPITSKQLESVLEVSGLKRLMISTLAIEKIPDKICDCENLKALFLSGPMPKLPDCIANSNIEMVRIAYASKLDSNLWKLKSLEHLYFSECANLIFPEEIKQLENLKTLEIVYSSFQTIHENFGHLPRLEEIRLSWMNGPIPLPEDCGNLPNLKWFKANQCEFESFPLFSGSNHLKYLEFKSCWKLTIPEEFFPYPELEFFFFYDFKGPDIPESLFQLPALEGFVYWSSSTTRIPVDAIVSNENLKCIGFNLPSYRLNEDDMQKILLKRNLEGIDVKHAFGRLNSVEWWEFVKENSLSISLNGCKRKESLSVTTKYKSTIRKKGTIPCRYFKFTRP